MAIFCTCGTELPDNARFCLNCGKPQREEDLASAAAASPETVPPPPAASGPAVGLPLGFLPVNFGNPIAVRIALLCASLIALLNVIPIVSFGCCLWISGGGFVSAVLYARRTGLSLSVRDGARLGWLTGLLTFVITVILTALNFALLRSAGGIRDQIRQSLEKMPSQDEAARQVLTNFLSSPSGLATLILSYILFGFFLIVCLAIAGGAMGAKVMEKE
jgi:hypothetical protein